MTGGKIKVLHASQFTFTTQCKCAAAALVALHTSYALSLRLSVPAPSVAMTLTRTNFGTKLFSASHLLTAATAAVASFLPCTFMVVLTQNCKMDFQPGCLVKFNV